MSPLSAAPGSVLEPPVGVPAARGTAYATPAVIDLRRNSPVVELCFVHLRDPDGGLPANPVKFEGQVFERRSRWRSNAVHFVEAVVVVAVLVIGALLLLSPSDTEGSRNRGVERGVLTGYVGVSPSTPGAGAP